MPLPTSSGVAHEPAVTMRTRSPSRRLSSSSAMRRELPAVPPVAGPRVHEHGGDLIERAVEGAAFRVEDRGVDRGL